VELFGAGALRSGATKEAPAERAREERVVRGGLEPPTFRFQFDSGSRRALPSWRTRMPSGGISRHPWEAVAVLIAVPQAVVFSATPGAGNGGLTLELVIARRTMGYGPEQVAGPGSLTPPLAICRRRDSRSS
jgi:hypothetical protein